MQRDEQGSAASRRAADVRTTHDATCVQAQHVPAPGLLQQPVLGFQAERKRCLAAGERHLHKSRDTGTDTVCVCMGCQRIWCIYHCPVDVYQFVSVMA
jgi:hypothetical protein